MSLFIGEREVGFGLCIVADWLRMGATSVGGNSKTGMLAEHAK